jgi:hypothetical protein
MEYLRCKNKIMRECISWQYKKIVFFLDETSKVISMATTTTIIKKTPISSALKLERTQPKPTLIE